MKIYLVDFENVKSKGLTGIEYLGEDDRVIVFYSENSDTISFEMHQKVLTSSAQIQYLKVNVGGKNALDFQLATLLGYLVGRDEYSHIFVISNDKGFDFLHDFWQSKFEPAPNCTVYRTRTIATAINFAQAGKSCEPTDDNVQAEMQELTGASEPEDISAAAETIETYEAQSEIPDNLSKHIENTVEKAAEEIVVYESHQEESVQKNVQQSDQVKQAETVKKVPKAKKKKPVTYGEHLTAALKSAECSEEDIKIIWQMLAASTTKEEFHNLLAKEFKAQATDYYKLLRPKYLRLKALYEAETSTEKPAETVSQKQDEPQEEKQIYHDVISARLAQLLAGLCSENELKIINELFNSVSTKQQLYIRMIKAFKKEKGCMFYNAIREEYANLHK